jgi:hypothetical protein
MFEDNKEELFGNWLREGIEMGWITDPYCATHDGGMQYWSEEEAQEWEDGGDPCQHVVRIMI